MKKRGVVNDHLIIDAITDLVGSDNFIVRSDNLFFAKLFHGQF